MRNRLHIPPRMGGVVLLLSWFLVDPEAAAAQVQPGTIRLPRIEVGGGVAWSGVSALGGVDATMTANETGIPGTSSFFKVDNEMKGAPSLAAWVGANLSQIVGVEGGFQYGRPDIRTRITADAEGVPETTFTARLKSQSIVEANLLLYASAGRFDQGRTIPFLILGAGYLKQRGTEQTIDETGRIYQVGLGLKWVSGLTRTRRARGPGLRLDVRYVVRDGGLDFQENVRRPYVTAGATALVAF